MTCRVNPVYTIILVRTAQASALALALHWLLRWPLTGPRALGLFFTPCLCLYFAFVFVAPWTWGLPILTRLTTREKSVALTFDDGPTPEITSALLGILARYDARATFFVLGENAQRHPETIQGIRHAGHDLGIHGFRHEPFVLMTGKGVGEEIAKTRAAIQAACPEAPEAVWLRPPHGFKTLFLPWPAKRHRCRLVTWSANAGDYREKDPAKIARTVLNAVRPGAIILLHDGACNAPTVAALPLILDGLAASGYRCVAL